MSEIEGEPRSHDPALSKGTASTNEGRNESATRVRLRRRRRRAVASILLLAFLFTVGFYGFHRIRADEAAVSVEAD